MVDVVKKIIGYAEKILDYCAEQCKDNFLENNMLAEACVFNMIQIGESTNLLGNVAAQQQYVSGQAFKFPPYPQTP